MVRNRIKTWLKAESIVLPLPSPNQTAYQVSLQHKIQETITSNYKFRT